MDKKIVIVAVICCAVFFVDDGYSQNQVVGGVQAKGMDMNLYPYGNISQFGVPEKSTTGSTYLYEDWKLGTAVLSSGAKIKEYPFNIDLANQTLEIMTNKGIRALEFKQIDSLAISNVGYPSQIFVNAKKYNGAEAQIVGLVEILQQGNIVLVKYNYIYVKEGAYNAALDMGNNETKLLVRNRYFLFSNELKTLVEVPKGKKKFLELLKDSDREAAGAFLSENNLGTKEERDIKLVVSFLNEKGATL